MRKSKLIYLLPLSALILSGCDIKETISNLNIFNKNNNESSDIEYDENGYKMKEIEEEQITVTFFKNIGKEELDLNSGMYATTSTTALKIDKIDKGSKVSRPERDPMRQNYEFDGWHTTLIDESLYDFDLPVYSNLVLYAHWAKVQEDEEFVEPEYVEPSHIDDTIDTLISVNGVLNMPVEDGKVKLSNAAISRLNRDPENVIDVLNYKVKNSVEVNASYDDSTKTITYHASKQEEYQEGTIIVQNNAANLIVDNGTYETKAANYEANDVAFEDHRIMLAGSSSIENWKNSTTDMLPLHTYNHGIGGTTVEQWRDKLNQRLVYPYSPRSIVYYVGVNNMKDGVNTGAETGQWLTEMFDDVHAHLPNTHIYYVLVNELPGFRNRQAEFDVANQICLDYEAEHNFLTCLNAGTGLLKANGEPNQAYFLFDGIHMSLAGYAIWGKYIKDKLIADYKQNA